MVDESQFDTLRREMRVLIEGVHDHIRLVAEASAGQSEATNRRLDALEVKVDRLEVKVDGLEVKVDRLEVRVEHLHQDNLSQHRTLLSVLGDHENRITALERDTN